MGKSAGMVTGCWWVFCAAMVVVTGAVGSVVKSKVTLCVRESRSVCGGLVGGSVRSDSAVEEPVLSDWAGELLLF